MADNVAITAGSGTNIATDDVGGTHYQRMKMSVGADGVVKDFQPATVVAVAADTADATPVATPCTLVGWSFAETSGTTGAKLYLRDGSGGTIVAVLTLAPNESLRESAPQPGLIMATGVYIDRASGSTEGSVWYIP